MSDSKDNAGTLPMKERITPRQLPWNLPFVNQTSTQSEGTSGDNTPPAALARQQNYSSNDDDEVPSSVPLVHPSNTLDFEDNDEDDRSYDAAEAEAYSSDDDEVPLAAIAQKSQTGG